MSGYAPAIAEILRTDDDGVATLTMSNADAANALTTGMRDDLIEAITVASADLRTRCLVLTGAGDRHFCTGAALGSPPPPRPRPDGAPDSTAGDVARTLRTGWQPLVTAIVECDKPVVASVNGTAAGGGAHLVLACDLVVMADTASLIEVFVRRGIVPDSGGAWLLPRLVGMQRAKELMFLGDRVTATDAGAMGLANRVVSSDALQTETAALARRLAAGPTAAIAQTKRLLTHSFESTLRQSFDSEAVAQELVARTDDLSEGVAAFLERREPRFRGW